MQIKSLVSCRRSRSRIENRSRSGDEAKQHLANGQGAVFLFLRQLFGTTGGRYIFEKFFIADMAYLLQSDQIIYKDIAPPHFDKRVDTAAQRGIQHLQSGCGLLLGQSTQKLYQ